MAHLADVYVANRTDGRKKKKQKQKGRVWSETAILRYQAENLIWGMIWNSDDVEGCLNSCATGDGVRRSSTYGSGVPSPGAAIVISRT